jgi:hypothetical protein
MQTLKHNEGVEIIVQILQEPITHLQQGISEVVKIEVYQHQSSSKQDKRTWTTRITSIN